MKSKVFKLIFGGIVIIIIIIILFFIFVVHNEVDSIVTTIKENNDNIEITCDCIDSAQKYYSHSISNEDGIISIKVKVSPVLGKSWPQKIIIDEKPEDIKTIEIVDGSNSKVIYS